MKIRKLNPHSSEEIQLVAQRMGYTLVDVLGEKRGKEMYTLDWLLERVQWHLDPQRDADIFLAQTEKGILGHAIIRRETQSESDFGYFSTIYVAPEFRGHGIASELIEEVVNWCKERNLSYIIYNTATNNHRLIELFKKFSFEIFFEEDEMVQLKKSLIF